MGVSLSDSPLSVKICRDSNTVWITLFAEASEGRYFCATTTKNYIRPIRLITQCPVRGIWCRTCKVRAVIHTEIKRYAQNVDKISAPKKSFHFQENSFLFFKATNCKNFIRFAILFVLNHNYFIEYF
jgi:hypothetical protein